LRDPILLLGFEPFGGRDLNPSQRLVEALARRPELEGIVRARILPVSAERLPPLLERALAETCPGAVLAFGLGSGPAIAVERVALNLCDFRIPDAGGKVLVDEPVVPGGPAAYFSTLPTREIAEALSRSGIPARLSLSAGSYLCNYLLYLLLHRLEGKGRTGFLHLPLLPEMVAGDIAAGDPAEPSMSFDLMLRAAQLAVEILRHPT
jgi:pyroglutamyl-peptidase